MGNWKELVSIFRLGNLLRLISKIIYTKLFRISEFLVIVVNKVVKRFQVFMSKITRFHIHIS